MNKHNNKGIALVTILWIVIILSSILSAIAYNARLELRQSYYAAREIQLVSAAMSCVEKVKAKIVNDNNPYTSLKGEWKNAFKDGLTLDDISLSVLVEDEESKLNLNCPPTGSIKRLASLNGNINSNSIEEYLKNKQLDCLEEILTVNASDNPDTIEFINKTTTVNSDARININTAQAEVLMMLPGIDYLLAQGIIARRNGKDLIQGTEDDLPYDNINRVEEVTGKDIFNRINGLITVKSSHFKVTVTAAFGKYRKTVEAMLYKNGQFVTVQYWKES
jgi:type II secretory pathway component PulK